ncbi:MAG: hypothetical protein ACRDYX_22820 [Egibacteraceae bacterium]
MGSRTEGRLSKPEQPHDATADPSRSHLLEVRRLAAACSSQYVYRVVARCTCGWCSADYLIDFAAPVPGGQERAYRQAEDAAIAHLRALARPPGLRAST